MGSASLVVFLILVAVCGTMAYFAIRGKAPVEAPALPQDDATVPAFVPTDGKSSLGLAPGWYPTPEGNQEVYFDGETWGEARPRTEAPEAPKARAADDTLEDPSPTA